jgi:hypothetical protein
MSRRFEADTNALQTTGWSGPPDADDFPVRMKPLQHRQISAHAQTLHWTDRRRHAIGVYTV